MKSQGRLYLEPPIHIFRFVRLFLCNSSSRGKATGVHLQLLQLRARRCCRLRYRPHLKSQKIHSPTHYSFLKSNDGDAILPPVSLTGTTTSTSVTRIPGRKVIHLFMITFQQHFSPTSTSTSNAATSRRSTNPFLRRTVSTSSTIPPGIIENTPIFATPPVLAQTTRLSRQLTSLSKHYDSNEEV